MHTFSRQKAPSLTHFDFVVGCFLGFHLEIGYMLNTFAFEFHYFTLEGQMVPQWNWLPYK